VQGRVSGATELEAPSAAALAGADHEQVDMAAESDQRIRTVAGRNVNVNAHAGGGRDLALHDVHKVLGENRVSLERDPFG